MFARLRDDKKLPIFANFHYAKSYTPLHLSTTPVTASTHSHNNYSLTLRIVTPLTPPQHQPSSKTGRSFIHIVFLSANNSARNNTQDQGYTTQKRSPQLKTTLQPEVKTVVRIIIPSGRNTPWWETGTGTLGTLSRGTKRMMLKEIKGLKQECKQDLLVRDDWRTIGHECQAGKTWCLDDVQEFRMTWEQ